jgi:hypothetical protein
MNAIALAGKGRRGDVYKQRDYSTIKSELCVLEAVHKSPKYTHRDYIF